MMSVITSLLMVESAVTVESQAVTFGITGFAVTVFTIVFTAFSKRKTDTRANEQRNLENKNRLEEKANDLANDIAKEARMNARQDTLQAHLELQAEKTNKKLDAVKDLGEVTHAIVNSGATAAMKDQRDGWIVTLALMKEIETLKKHNGEEPTEDTHKATALLQQRIATMESNIADRVKQQELAESMIAVEKEIIERSIRKSAQV